MTSAERAPTLDALKPYPAYKDSGVEWIGDIPQGWDIIRLKFAASIVNARAEEKPEHLRYLGLEHIEGGTARLTDAPEPLQVTSIVGLYEADDVLFGKLRPYLMKVHLAEAPGCSSTEIVAFRSHSETSPRFLKYWLLSHGLISTTDMLTFGSKMPRVAPEQLANLPFVAVPVSEQNAIAAFLDHETARIDALVREQELLLEDLAAKRRSTITAAVTTGVSPRKIQATDIPWLSFIPQHWKIAPLKHLVQLQGGMTPPDEPRFWNGDVPWVTPKDMKFPIITNTEDKVAAEAVTGGRLKLSLSGCLLMVVRSGILRHTVPVATNAVSVTVNQDMKVLQPIAEVRAKYLYYFFEGLGPSLLPIIQKVGATVESINMAALRNLQVTVPPLTEQDEIIDYLDRTLAQIDALVTTVRANIEDMKLLRSTLITAATTGKIDVRDWSPA